MKKRLCLGLLICFTGLAQAETLSQLRKEVDNVDEQIVQLLAKRTKVVHQIAMQKQVNYSQPMKMLRHVGREQDVISNVTKWARQYGADVDTTREIYRCTMDSFLKYQENVLVTEKMYPFRE